MLVLVPQVMADVHAGVWADLSVVATDHADRRARKLMLREQRRRRRRCQLAAAMLEADNDSILHQTEVLALLQPEAAANAAMNFRFAHESAVLLHCESQSEPREVYVEPIQSMRTLTYEYLGMTPGDVENEPENGEWEQDDVDTPPAPTTPVLRTSISDPMLRELEAVPERTSKLYQRIQRDRIRRRSMSEDSDTSAVSNELAEHNIADHAQLQSFRERVFERRISRRVTSGRRHSLAATSWPEDQTYPLADADSTYAEIMGPPEISVFESFESSRDSDSEMQSGMSRTSRTLADATRRMFRTSEDAGPFAPMLQRRRTMQERDHTSRKWLKPKRIVRVLLGKNKEPENGLYELDLNEPEQPPEEHERPEYPLHDHGPLFVPAPLANTAFAYRSESLWKDTEFYAPHGAFRSEGGIIVPHSEPLPLPDEGTRQGPSLDIGPVAVPVQIGRRVLYPTTALFRNALARHPEEHEGWGWEKYTNAAAYFNSIMPDDSDSDDDEPLMDVRIQARKERVAMRRMAHERARQRRMQRGARGSSDTESGDASADADTTDPDAPWQDDLRPVGRLFGTSLINIATLQEKERKALVRFYGQTNLDGGDSLGLNDTRERMEQAFGPQTHWHNEMVARLQRDAMQTEDPELAAQSLTQLKELAAQVAAQAAAQAAAQEQDDAHGRSSSPLQRRSTRFRRPLRGRGEAKEHVDETVKEWHEDESDHDSGAETDMSEDDMPLAHLQHDSDDEDQPLGVLHPQAGIIAEQATLIRQLLAENEYHRMSLGSFGMTAPSQRPARIPVPSWMQPREPRRPQSEQLEEDLLDEPVEEEIPEVEAQPPAPLEHYAGELSEFLHEHPEQGLDPAMTAVMDPMVLDQGGETSLAQAEAAAPAAH